MESSHSNLSESDSGPLVTIGIPTFNRVHWLKDCILSALAQSYQRYEIIVSDNASTDGTAGLLRQFSDPRLRVVTQERNLGPMQNWNVCVTEAKGDYIVIVPDDDRIAPWMLDRCVSLLRTDPGLAVIIGIGDVYLVADRQILPAIGSRKLATGIREGVDILEEYLRGRISAHVCTIMFRTEALRAIGGWPLHWPFAGDLATWMPILLSGRAGLVNESCGVYCSHAETQTSRFDIEFRLKDLQRIVHLIRAEADDKIADPKRRCTLESLAKAYFTRHAIGIIASRRRTNATLPDLLPVLWQWHRDLCSGLIRLKCGDLFPLARSLALLLLPAPLTRLLRRSIRALRRKRPYPAFTTVAQ
ncbi:glycosyltransferase family 2 protein [Bradyrhizobium sp. 159]|uniref:glycosyltransferase family 2 protein n=1 Tax=Bradyrhizobium sp. 159 TaxID=2782632 RepID=UPI001FFA5B5E|nr:glycosyltransferase family A protein [Bradyrhizobium sp. 159]MCK1619078.1 glycosyltransferase family 2 protein [Bradyrhizobium sp. 159]